MKNLFHLDVPWNPGRMEQRNGRIDRKLQPRETVYCHYFYYAQRAEDRVLATLVRKTATIQRELGSLAQSRDPVPRVILLGRLCLYGAQAARLHEELLAVTARWWESNQGKRPLKPYAREAESKTLDLLEEALAAERPTGIDALIQHRLLATAADDVQDLLPVLQQRGEECAEDAIRELQKRGEKEATGMRDILLDQQKRLGATAEKYREDSQLTLGFNDDERRQLEANQRHWNQRLAALTVELEREPTRIREVYTVRATRLEPVGLVYLWPVTG